MSINKLQLTCAVLLVVSAVVTAADIHYVWRNGGNVPPFTNWADAANVLQDAVNAAEPLDEVVVKDGVYAVGSSPTPRWSLPNRVLITNNIVVRSVNGPRRTVILGRTNETSAPVRCVYIENAELHGFTVSNGYSCQGPHMTYDWLGGGIMAANAVVSNCIITCNYDGGVNCLADATFLDCVISDNLTTDVNSMPGGGISGGTLCRCVVIGNESRYIGAGCNGSRLHECVVRENRGRNTGGCFRSSLWNSLVYGNVATDNGGGACESLLVNCTVISNIAYKFGGGVDNCLVTNSIVYGNRAFAGDNWMNSTFRFSCTAPLPDGEGNFSNDPLLVSLSHIASNSPCAAAGTSAGSSGVDIDGDPWMEPPSVGCDELSPSAMTGSLWCALRATGPVVASGYCVRLVADIQGKPSGMAWHGPHLDKTNTPLVSHTLVDPGTNLIVLTAWNNTFPQPPGSIACVTATLVVVTPQTVYASPSSPTPVWPYTNWSTAALGLQNAVDACAVLGGLVLATDGVYAVGMRQNSRVVVTQDITIASVNGPEHTIIDGGGTVRGVFLNAGTLCGFTVSNCNASLDELGGGGILAREGIVTNCLIVCNRSSLWGGGGVRGGVVRACTLTDNIAAWSHGGGAYVAHVEDSQFSRNSSSYGSALGQADAARCVIAGEPALLALESTLADCIVTNNGGGIQGSTLTRCLLAHNTYSVDASAAQDSTLLACTVVSNSSPVCGGGVRSCTVYDSLLGWNTAPSGGGAYGGCLSNCVCVLNSAETGGSACNSTVIDSTLVSNTAATGGALAGGSARFSVIAGNTATNGGGTANVALECCSVMDNRAVAAGGGISGQTAVSCLIAGNAAALGGGAFGSDLANCTVAGNTAGEGGGVSDCSGVNCIIWDNTAAASGNWQNSTLSYTCTDPVPPDFHSFSWDPLFVAPTCTDYRLMPGSLCIDAGSNLFGSLARDLDGNPRVVNDLVDLGAYEFVPEPGSAGLIAWAIVWLRRRGSACRCRG